MEDLRLSLCYQPARVEVNGVRFEVCRTDAQIVQDVMELAQRAARMENPAECNTEFSLNHAVSGDFSDDSCCFHTLSHVNCVDGLLSSEDVGAKGKAGAAGSVGSVGSAGSVSLSPPAAPPPPRGLPPSSVAALAAYLDTLLGAGARAQIAATLPGHPDAPLGNAPSAAVSQAIILRAARAYANAFSLRYGDATEDQP